MPNKNLFSRLIHYAPQEGRFAEENFFTELFAYILENNKAVLNKFLSQINPNIKNPRIHTQHSFNNETNQQIADILLIDPLSEEMIIIESKIQADFDSDQINGYLKLVKDKKDSKVISITKYDSEKLNNFKDKLKDKKKFNHFYWSQIYRILKDALKESTSENTQVIKEMMNFMEDKNMAEFEGFDDADGSIWSSFRRVDNKMNEYVNQLKIQIQKKYSMRKCDSDLYQYKGFFITPSTKKSKNDVVWIGLWNLDIEEENNFRLYCCIQIAQLNEGNEDYILKQFPQFKKNTHKFSGVMQYVPLMSIMKNVAKEQQIEELNKFFMEGLNRLENKGAFDLLFNQSKETVPSTNPK